MSQVIEAIIELVITTIGVYLFGRIALNKKIEVSKSKFLVFFIITVVCNTIIYLNLTGTLKTILMEITNIIFFVKVFKISMSKSIFLTLMHLITLIAAELIQILFLTNIIKMSINSLYSDFMKSILGSSSTLLILILMCLIFKIPIRYFMNTRVENNKKILIYSISVLILD